MDTLPSPAPVPVSRETGRTRTARFTVWSLDVWGHSPADCHEHDCSCMIEGDSDEGDVDDVPKEHDDNAGDCHCEVNDRCRVGVLDVTETETEYNVGTAHAFTSWSASDDVIRDALVEQGFADADKRERIGFDDPSSDGTDIYVEDSTDGRPAYQLERETPEEDA